MTDRIWTIPNLMSMLRLLGIPLFVWLILFADEPVWGFVLLVAAGVSDFLDGWLARRLQQTSRLGQLLDPLVDRLYIATTLIVLALAGFVPWWLVLLIALRDVVLLLTLPALRRHGRIALPVTPLGKAGTFALMWGFPILLLASVSGPLGSLAFVLGWSASLWGTWVYWWAGGQYLAQVAAMTRAPAPSAD